MTIIAACFALIAVIATCFCTTGYAFAKDENIYDNSEFVDNEIILTVKGDAEYAVGDFSFLGCVGVEKLSYGYPTTYLLKLEQHSKQNVLTQIEMLKKQGFVYSAYPNFVYKHNAIAYDYYDINQGSVANIQLTKAWDIETGKSSVKVGVIDTGIDGNHEELVNRVDKQLSKNFNGDSTSALYDPHGHGTHVAGIIGAAGSNDVGITGVCWDVTLVSLKVAGSDGKAKTSNIVQAINYAAQQNIPILNMSIGDSRYDAGIIQAITNYKGLFVCSSGNARENVDTGAIHTPNMLVVNASDESDNICSFSNYGLEQTDIFAPGDFILSCYPTEMCENETHDIEHTVHISNGYHVMAGTSMAAPFVTGVAALLLSKYPNMTVQEIKLSILDNVEDITSFSELCSSGGRLDAYGALKYAHITHTYTDSYTTNGTSHTAYCICGVSQTATHNYRSSYTWVDGTQHKAYCECGEYKLQKHYVASTSPFLYAIGPGQYKTCLYCHGRADMGFVLSQGIRNSFATPNGSYILPNGVCVIAPNDMDALFNGTLVFYSKNAFLAA